MDSYLPADFFIVEESAFVSGLRDWSRPRGPYPGKRHRPPRGSATPPSPPARRRGNDRRVREIDEEWQPL